MKEGNRERRRVWKVQEGWEKKRGVRANRKKENRDERRGREKGKRGRSWVGKGGRSEGEGRAREKDGGELRGVSCPLVQHSGMLLKEVCCVNRESFSGLLNAHRNMGPLNPTGEERHGSYLKGKKEEKRKKRRKSYS